MKIRFIKDIKCNFNKENAINVVNFEQAGVINFRREIEGKEKNLVFWGKKSLALGGITLVGGICDNCGFNKKSVFVFEGGRLTSICDMNRYEEKYSTASGYKIIEYENKKIGILVDLDLYSPDAVKALTLCGVGAIINLYEDFSAKKALIASEFYSYVYGVDFIHFSKNQSVCFDCFGSEAQIKNGVVSVEGSGVYKEVRIKKRGF